MFDGFSGTGIIQFNSYLKEGNIMDMYNVALWIGTVKSEADFYEYTEFRFNEDAPDDDEYDGYECKFAKDFKIDLDDIDEDFMEVNYIDHIAKAKELLKDCSYYDGFIDQIPCDLEGNCFVLIFDYKYKKKVKNKNGIAFIGNFEFEDYV